MRLDEGFTATSVIARKPLDIGRYRRGDLDAMRRPDDVPVNGKPAQEGAGERDECELELGDDAQIAAPDADSCDNGECADHDGEHCDEVLEHEPFEPCWRGRHDVVALHDKIADKRAEKQDPDKSSESRRSREPDR